MASKFFHGSSLLIGNNTIPGVQLPKDLRDFAQKILYACKDWGLDFYPTVVQLLTYDEISEVAAYGGFPVRYPHWSFGMQYEELQRGYEFGAHKIYEMVINASPCYIYCLDSNTLLDHLTVIAHATGHNDFFKNNIHFSATDTNMLNNMANHASRIKKYMTRWGKERVTEFLDYLLRIDTLIDGASAWHQKVIKDRNIADKRDYRVPVRLKVDSDRFYMDSYINTKDFKVREDEKAKDKDLADELGFFIEPVKDIFGFLRDNAPLKPWQQDIMSMIYEESMYFYPQRQTKVLNEGWACGKKNTLVCTDHGVLTLKDIVDKKLKVAIWDGNKEKLVTNWFKFENRDVYRVVTKRGYKFEGSNNHRILNSDGKWIRLENMQVGGIVKIVKSDLWNVNYQIVSFQEPPRRIELKDIAKMADVSYSKLSYRKYSYKGKVKDDQLDKLVEIYDNQSVGSTRNIMNDINIPEIMNEELASFIGYMIGDGHISIKKRTLGLTTGDDSQANDYCRLMKKLFGLKCKKFWDDSSKNGRWRLSVYSRILESFLVSLGMKTGVCAREKDIPSIILRSPKTVLAAFLRSYFDCDGYAGVGGVILSTSSETLSHQVQVVLLNFDIMSTRRLNKDGCWHVNVTGTEARKFYESIGFGLKRKQNKLKRYLNNHKWFIERKCEDEIVSVEKIGCEDVYDITVSDTHRYVAQGFTNHNSTVDHVIMAEQGYVSLGQKTHDSGIIDYAIHKMGVLGGKYSTNPYKLGFNLLMDIKKRWDKGQFGTEWDKCTNSSTKEKWDTKAMLGKEKIFEVRKYYDDLTLIHEFFTDDFCREQEYFEYKKYPNGETVLESHDHKKIKRHLMARHVNGGLPDIRLAEPNYKGKGYLMLEHHHDGRPLYDPYLRDVMVGLRFIWQNDVFLSTKGHDGSDVVYECFDSDPANIKVKGKK